MAANSQQDFTSANPHISHLVKIIKLGYDASLRQRVSMQLNSNSWSVALDSHAKMLQFFFGKCCNSFSENAGTANVSLAVECMATARHICTPRA